MAAMEVGASLGFLEGTVSNEVVSEAEIRFFFCFFLRHRFWALSVEVGGPGGTVNIEDE